MTTTKGRGRFTVYDGGTMHLSLKEVKMILRGARPLVTHDDHQALARVLKGVQGKNATAHESEGNPYFGSLSHLVMDAIEEKIDWLLQNRYLTLISRSERHVLMYTPRGWALEVDAYTDELIDDFDRMLKSRATHFLVSRLRYVDRESVWCLLDKIEARGDVRYIRILDAWQRMDCKAVRRRIHGVIVSLSGGVSM